MNYRSARLLHGAFQYRLVRTFERVDRLARISYYGMEVSPVSQCVQKTFLGDVCVLVLIHNQTLPTVPYGITSRCVLDDESRFL